MRILTFFSLSFQSCETNVACDLWHLIAKIFLKYFTHHTDDIDLLFMLLKALCLRFIPDFQVSFIDVIIFAFTHLVFRLTLFMKNVSCLIYSFFVTSYQIRWLKTTQSIGNEKCFSTLLTISIIPPYHKSSKQKSSPQF